MRVAFIGDLHLHLWTEFSTPTHGGRNSRLDDLLRGFHWAVKVADRKGCDMVVQLGDVFHERDKISVPVLNGLTSLFQGGASISVPTFILVGNHDLYARDPSVHALQGIGDIVPGLDIVDTARIVEVSGVRFLMVPFYRTSEEWDSKCRDLYGGLEGEGTDVWVTHNLIGTARVTSSDFALHDQVDMIPEIHGGARLMVAGHIHKPQEVERPGLPTVHYAGSLSALTFGDAGQVHSMSILDTESWEIERIPNPFSPLFVQFEAQDEAQKVNVLDQLESLRKEHPGGVFAEVSSPDPALLRSVQAQIEGIRTLQTDPNEDTVLRLGVEHRSDPADVLRAFVEARPHPSLSKEGLVSIGMEILESVKEG